MKNFCRRRDFSLNEPFDVFESLNNKYHNVQGCELDSIQDTCNINN